ncbi:MAG TPA: hypothetical protein PLK32_06390 [Defluviitoga tunisiensis]|nr:hypothetical protein [Defluviitoga tunisiensis]
MFRKDKQIDIDGLKEQLNSQNKEMADFEARQNLLGFFSLLLEIDKRNNPQNYKKSQNNEDNRNTDNTN